MMPILNKKRERELSLFVYGLSFVLILAVPILPIYSHMINSIDIEGVRKIIDKENIGNSVISIIDNGVQLNHQTTSNSVWINSVELENGIDDDMNGYVDDINGWNFKNNTNDVSNKGIGNWHGTPVNSLINSICSIDVSSKIMNIVKGDSVGDIIASFDYIYEMRRRYNESNGTQGANIVVINCSWGKDLLWASDYPAWCEIYNKLGEVGVLCVSSVPNASMDIDSQGDMPSTCTSDYLITVTNTYNNQKVYGAAYGSKSVDIGAPGKNSYTLLNNGEYGYFGGTSAAAPYVTGVLALLYSLPS